MLDEAVQREEAVAALADRANAVQARLAYQATQRAIRKQTFNAYPINLPDRLLTRQQRAERRENAEDVLRAIGQYLGSPLLSDRQRNVLTSFAFALRTSRGSYAVSPAEWEAFWSIRDFLYPPEM